MRLFVFVAAFQVALIGMYVFVQFLWMVYASFMFERARQALLDAPVDDDGAARLNYLKWAAVRDRHLRLTPEDRC